MFKKIFIFFCLSISVFLLGCSDKQLSAEDEIRLFIKRGVEAAESRSASDLGEMIHDSYVDPRGMNKQQVIKLLRLYFFRHKNIFLLTKIQDIDIQSKDAAFVTLHVAMAGNVISDASMLSSLRARVYRFELQLVRQDEWLLEQATWAPANMSDIQ